MGNYPRSLTPPCKKTAAVDSLHALPPGKGVSLPMPNSQKSPTAAIVLTVGHLKGITIGAGVLMILVGVGGLAVSLLSDGRVPLLRLAYTGSLIGLVIGGLITMLVGTIKGLGTVVHHQAGIEKAAAERFDRLEALINEKSQNFGVLERMIDEKIEDGFQDRFDQLEQLTASIQDLVQRQAVIIGDVFEKQLQHERDEVARRRDRRNG